MRLIGFFLVALASGLALHAERASVRADRRLVEAVKAGDRAEALALLRQHAGVNTPEADGTTALHWAVRRDDLDLTDRLIRAGADVTAANRYGVTPLYLACQNGSASTIERLLAAGADANAAAGEGETALMTVARTGSVEAARVLLAHGAALDARGRTPLSAAVAANTMPASNRPAPKVIDNRTVALELVTMLLDHGASPNARLKKQQPYRTKLDRGTDTMLGAGTTPFLRAARAADLAAMRILLAHGADPKLATGSDVPND